MAGKIIVEAQAMTAVERRLAAANLIVALVALFGGVTTGIFQALEYAGVDDLPVAGAGDPLVLPQRCRCTAC